MIRSRLGLSAAGEPVLVLLLVIAVVVLMAQSPMGERFSSLVVLGGNATAAAERCSRCPIQGETKPLSGWITWRGTSTWISLLHTPLTSLADDLPGGLSAHITDQARNSSGLFVIWPSAPEHPRSLRADDGLETRRRLR